MRFTKITASIGPKCEDRETLTKMIAADGEVERV